MENHFIDSNVFLGFALENSSKMICENYFQFKSAKFTSNTVELESKEVIHKLLVMVISSLKFISGYVHNNNLSDGDIASNIKVIKNEFISKYEYLEYPFGFKREKFLSLTHALFDQYFDLIKRGIYFEPFDSLLENYSNEISLSYKRSLNSLNMLFKQVKIYSFAEYGNDKKVMETLNKYNIHYPDSKILLDAFKLTKILKSNLFFITEDNGIIDNDDIISCEFNSSIIPKKPEDFVNA